MSVYTVWHCGKGVKMEHPVVSPTVPPERWETTLPSRVLEMSRKVKIIRFGFIKEGASSPWQRLVGIFRLGRPVDIEEILDARGFDESADYV